MVFWSCLGGLVVRAQKEYTQAREAAAGELSTLNIAQASTPVSISWFHCER
jgi:hypothetical protein